jgi:hypothetical protein
MNKTTITIGAMKTTYNLVYDQPSESWWLCVVEYSCLRDLVQSFALAASRPLCVLQTYPGDISVADMIKSGEPDIADPSA